MDWASAEAALESGVASVFDKGSFRLLPRKAGITVNHGAVADAARAEFDFAGTIDLGPPFLPAGRGNAADPTVRERTAGYEAVLGARRTGWPYLPVRGDIVRDLATGQEWTIETRELDGSARVAFNLNRVR